MRKVSPTCAFCQIAADPEAASYFVAASAAWVAFFPDHPASLGHTLVIPRRHVTDLWAASPVLASDLVHAAQRVGHAVRDVTAADGINLITSAGVAGEQTVFHAHLHLLPRWHDDSIDVWPKKAGEPGKVELDQVAHTLRSVLATSS